MVALYVSLLLAVAAAAAVLVVAGVIAPSDHEDGDETPAPRERRTLRTVLTRGWRDARAGAVTLFSRRSEREPRPDEGDRAESNTSVEEFFAATETSQPAYLDADEITDVLHRLRSELRPQRDGAAHEGRTGHGDSPAPGRGTGEGTRPSASPGSPGVPDETGGTIRA